MDPEDRPNRPPADDSSFLDRLSDLDRGLDEPASRPPQPVTSGTPARAPSTSTSDARGPRRLLDLFPPEAKTESSSAFDLVSKPAPAPASPRRPFPLIDTPPAPLPPPPVGRSEPAQPREEESVQGASKPHNFEAFYGLQEHPFSLSSDPRLLYHSTAHDRAAQSMLDAIRARHGIVVLTGPIGIGKTMLCRAIVEQLDQRTLTSLVADPFGSAEQLLRTVLVDFGVISAADLAKGKLAKAPRAELAAALRDFLYTLAPLDAFAVVIIDEAHALSIQLLDQIRVLADTGGEQHLLQVILVGEPALNTKIGKPELRGLSQRVTVRVKLGPLAADEIDPYLRHRLSVAGLTSRLVFNERARTRLFELSGGVARVINLLSERALAVGHQKRAGTIDQWMVNRAADELDLAPPAAKQSATRVASIVVALLVLMLLGAAGGLYVFRVQVQRFIDQWVSQPAPPPKPSLPLPTPYTPTPAEQLERETKAQDLI